jgi:hypothetical protein
MTYTHCCVQCLTSDDGQRYCPKHVVLFQKKNKFEILVHLVGFIIRIYHEARSPERQMPNMSNLFEIIVLLSVIIKTKDARYMYYNN